MQDPGNVGAIVRVAEAGGGSGLVAAGGTANPLGWKALRGSMGSALRLPVAVEPATDQAVADARRHGCRLVAMVPRGGQPHGDSDLRGRVAILVGGEGARHRPVPDRHRGCPGDDPDGARRLNRSTPPWRRRC